jgi:pre-rRNA-processing protein IPI1
MGRPKGGAASSSKKPKAKQKQRGGVDFKVPPAHRFCSLRDLILRRRVKPFSWRSQKYKHKVGRKLPPPKNATNTEIKSKGTATSTSTFFFLSLLASLRCNWS